MEIIEHRFRPPGWRGEEFYFQPYDYGVHLGLEARIPGVRVMARPDTLGTCSDCPPMTAAQFRGRSWDLLSNEATAVFRAGTIRSIYYRGEGPYRTRMILRLRDAGEEELIVEREKRKGTMLNIASLRVSPDERYLAYVVDSKKQAFFAGSRAELLIRDIASGRELKIATYGYLSNVIWSPDSERLYFAGGEYETDSAVRVVDVTATFSK